MIALHNEFRVDLPIGQAWGLLTDLPQVARCLPGASLEDVVDGEYRGGLTTRIGPVSARYRGVASFRERDDVSHRAVIEARGREERGSGSASALITVVLKPENDSTLVDVDTELAISGRAAQFGRSLMTEVSTTMLGEFVHRLEAMISERGLTPRQAHPTPATAQADRVAGRPALATQDDSLDAMRLIVVPMLRKAVVPIIAATVGIFVGTLWGRRRSATMPAGRQPGGYLMPYSESNRADPRG